MLLWKNTAGIRMATEIELKAWVSNPEELGRKLSGLAVFIGNFEKSDAYFQPVNSAETPERPGYGVRLRKEKTKNLNGVLKELNYVTYKSKQVRDGIEVNDEREFEVSSASAFEEFLEYIGYRESIKKHKTGNSYKNDSMTVELTEVQGLGWFIELEILAAEQDDENTEAIKKRLLSFLDQLEIPRKSIESRSYAEMLKNPRATGE